MSPTTTTHKTNTHTHTQLSSPPLPPLPSNPYKPPKRRNENFARLKGLKACCYRCSIILRKLIAFILIMFT